MFKAGLTFAAIAIAAGLALASPASAQGKKVFFLLSHGGPSDAFWIDWNAGATKACEQFAYNSGSVAPRARNPMSAGCSSSS